jgi:uncharacterized protein (UPF0218 family)
VTDVVLELQAELRSELKEPFGPVSTDVDAVLASAGEPLVTVGDIVTYHVLQADTTPDVALVDERTERAAVDETVRRTVLGNGASGFDREVEVANPPATLTADLLAALGGALDLAGLETTLLVVDGEEDLAALPAIAAAPDGATVLYGQPGEGVVDVTADSDVRERVVALVERMDGDPGRCWAQLGVDK